MMSDRDGSIRTHAESISDGSAQGASGFHRCSGTNGIEAHIQPDSKGRRLKIAHLTTAAISLRYLLLPQLKAVARTGGCAIGISAADEHVGALESSGVQHVALRYSTRSRDFGSDIRVIGELWRVLRRTRPDVLHTHNPKPGVYGRIVGRLAGVPVVLNTVHGIYASPDDSAAKKSAVYTLEAVASRFSDYELVQSVEDYDLLTRRRITRPNRTILIGNGVDVRRFDPDRISASDRAAIREELGLAPSDFVTGIVARLVRGKGFIELTEAAERLDGRHVIVAIGPEDRDKSDALSPTEIARAEAAGIRFLGHRDDVDRLYAAMDAFVLPSHREGFPRAAMEAAAMGLPVVASDIRGCRQVVNDGVTGILFPVRSTDDIAAALTVLADDPSLRSGMGAAARTKALIEFDERSVVDTVLRMQIRALREKGHFERLETDDDAALTLRWATEEDLSVLAAISASASDRRPSSPLAAMLSRHRHRSELALRMPDLVVAEDAFGSVGFATIPAARGPQGPKPGRTRRVRHLLLGRSRTVPLRAPRTNPGGEQEVRILIAEPFQETNLEERLRDWLQEHEPPQAERQPPMQGIIP